jgi:hypothetical protein
MAWSKIAGQSQSDAWDFNTQAEMEGEFVRVEEKVGPNNSKLYHFLVGDGADQEEVVVWGSTVLDSRLVDVKHGDKIKIVYLGKAKSKRGTEYRNFDVFLDVNPLQF